MGLYETHSLLLSSKKEELGIHSLAQRQRHVIEVRAHAVQRPQHHAYIVAAHGANLD